MKAANPRGEAFPQRLESQLKRQLGDFSDLLKRKPYLPSCIQSISDHFMLKRQASTPWSHEGVFEAYLVYFHTLNVVRLVSALRHLKRADISLPSEVVSALDFGSGLGAAEIAWQEVFPEWPLDWTFVESESKVAVWHEKLRNGEPTPQTSGEWCLKIPPQASPDIFFASYSLNEIDQLPPQALRSKILVILEPSDRYHSRQLMTWRRSVMEAGFSLIAPCTHALDCPLLKHSKSDFCHDRVPLRKPDWFERLEQSLPMKNDSLTFSYLIAVKEPQTKVQPQNLARVIGDTLKEKGKTKQAICRSDQREFLSWLDREGKAQFLPHGSLVQLPSDFKEIKGSELRVGALKLSTYVPEKKS